MPLRRSSQLNRLFFITLLAGDMMIIGLSIAAAVLLRFGSLDTPSAPFSAMLGTWAFLVLAEATVMMVENLYLVRTTVNRSMNMFRTIRMILAISVIFIVVLFLTHFPDRLFISSRLSVLYMVVFWMSLTLFSRIVLFPRIFGLLIGLFRFRKIPMIIFAGPGTAVKIRNTLLRSRAYGRVLDLTLYTDDLPDDADGRFAECLEIMREHGASELMMVFEEEDFDFMARFSMLMRREGIPFVIFSRRIIELGYFDPWLTVGNYGALTFCSSRWSASSRLLWRMVDIAGAVIGMVVFLPVILVTAPAVALTSRGGILYRQTRIGYGERAFTFFKFRSMRLDAEDRHSTHRKYFQKYVKGGAASDDSNGKVFKTISPGAVTPVGKIIRRTSIDELPQMLNVLRGEMSIVGPRPCIEYELEHYSSEWMKRRFSVKPGLTGIWQVYGRSRLSFEKSQFLDFVYVISRTDGLNIRLILMTFPVMLFGKGGL